jgi:parallel beta-helix repeat protein
VEPEEKAESKGNAEMNSNKPKLFGTLFALLLLCAMYSAGSFQTVKSQYSGPVYIRSDGSIDPSTAPIQRVENVYTLLDTFVGNITVEKDNVVIDGASYAIEGTAIGTTVTAGVDLSFRSNVTIKNMQIRSFVNGIRLLNSFYNNLVGNNIMENVDGIRIENSTGNSVFGNNITANRHGIHPFEGNKFYSNNFVNSTDKHVYVDLPDQVNSWDNDYPSGGNYWSTYTGVDEKKGPNQNEAGSDGISDTPFIIDDNNIDRYPLIAPFREQGQVQPAQDQTWLLIGAGLIIITVIVIVSMLLSRKKAKKTASEKK